MCLDKVTEQIPNPTPLIKSGKKTFRNVGKDLQFDNFAYQGKNAAPLDQWLTAEGPKIKAGDGTQYQASFHVYEEDDNKVRSGTRRVYVRHVHTRGEQGGSSIMVATELYVPSDPEAWPPTVSGPDQPPTPAPASKEDSALKRLKKRITGKPGEA